MILLDTCILIDLERYALPAEERFAASILSRAELEFGVRRASTPELRDERMARLDQLDRRFAWLAFDIGATRAYGVVAASATVSGARRRGRDALIAAQAHQHGAALATANTADFAPFAHLVEVVELPPRGKPTRPVE